MKRYLSLIIALCMLVCLFVACDKANKDEPTQAPTTAPTEVPTENNTEKPTENSTEKSTEASTEAEEKVEYTLHFVDYKGETMTSFSGVMTLSGGDIAPITKGKATIKVTNGEYDAIFDITNGDGYEYDEEFHFSEDTPNAVITVYNKVTDTNKDFYASDYGAGYVGVGATYVKLRGVTGEGYEGQRSFFIFKPEKDGIYKVSVLGDQNVHVGYHGGTVLTIFSHSLNEVVDNSFEIEFRKSMIGADSPTVCVIGLTNDGSAKDSVLVIERIADAPLGFDDLNWQSPKLEKEPTEHRLTYQNKVVTLHNLDLFDENLKLVLGDDGYYHLGSKDGELVYVRITIPTDYFGSWSDATTGTSGSNMASFFEINETDPFCHYYTDENGLPLRKESYKDILDAYAAVTDVCGVYPLDEMLEYIIKSNGEQKNWWNYDVDYNLFTRFGLETPPVENAWLFAACTVEINDAANTEDTAAVINIDGGTSLIGKNDTVYLTVNEKPEISVTLTVNAGEGIVVLYNGAEYTPDDKGVIELTITEDKNLVIVGSESMTDKIEVSYTYDYVV